jgi:hypothetical protein
MKSAGARVVKNGPPPATALPPPMRPRRGLFAALIAVLVLWLAGLLVMYFTTVQPRRQPATDAAHPLETLP